MFGKGKQSPESLRLQREALRGQLKTAETELKQAKQSRGSIPFEVKEEHVALATEKADANVRRLEDLIKTLNQQIGESGKRIQQARRHEALRLQPGAWNELKKLYLDQHEMALKLSQLMVKTREQEEAFVDMQRVLDAGDPKFSRPLLALRRYYESRQNRGDRRESYQASWRDLAEQRFSVDRKYAASDTAQVFEHLATMTAADALVGKATPEVKVADIVE